MGAFLCGCECEFCVCVCAAIQNGSRRRLRNANLHGRVCPCVRYERHGTTKRFLTTGCSRHSTWMIDAEKFLYFDGCLSLGLCLALTGRNSCMMHMSTEGAPFCVRIEQR